MKQLTLYMFTASPSMQAAISRRVRFFDFVISTMAEAGMGVFSEFKGRGMVVS